MAFPEKAFPKKLFPWNGFTIKDNSCTLYLVLHTPYVFFDKSFGKRFGGLSGKRFGGLSGKFFYRVYNEMKSCIVRSKSNLQWDEKSLYPEGILPLYPSGVVSLRGTGYYPVSFRGESLPGYYPYTPIPLYPGGVPGTGRSFSGYYPYTPKGY